MGHSIYPMLQNLISPNSIIIEIGAHIGTDTQKLYELLKPKKLYAIEPDPRNIIELVRLHLPIKVIKCAIGNTNGRVAFYRSSGLIPGKNRVHTDSGSLLKPVDHPNRPKWVTFDKTEVFCFRLDDLMRDIDRVDLIWMDVQGAELMVIEGGYDTLAKTKYLYLECQEERYEGQPGEAKVLEALKGWSIVERSGDNILLKNDTI